MSIFNGSKSFYGMPFFWKLAPCLEKAKKKEGQGVVVFAREYANKKRAYTYATRETFYDQYCMMPPEERAWAELLPTGCPCTLYFDLDYSRSVVDEAVANRIAEMVEVFMCLTKTLLCELELLNYKLQIK